MKQLLSLFSLTVIVLFFETPPLTHAEQQQQQQQQQQQRIKRKPSTNNAATNTAAADSSQQDNYIITHYGLEYYTPVTESSSSSIQTHNDGYFTAEIIPVDPKTGEELKTINNLYVPLHTGYSIGDDHQRTKQFAFANDRKATNSRENEHQSQSTNNTANKQSQSSSKRKFEKKYKIRNTDPAKKNLTILAESSTRDQKDKTASKLNASFADDTNKRNQKIFAN